MMLFSALGVYKVKLHKTQLSDLVVLSEKS